MTHLDPHAYDPAPRAARMRSAVEKQLHHTQNMLLAAALASIGIVIVAASFMASLP